MRFDRRRLEENFFKALMLAASGCILLVLLAILGTILGKGFSSMSWEMLTKTPEGGFYLGGRGGVLNAILGTLYLAGGATVAATFLSLPVALYLNSYRRKDSKLTAMARFSFDVLWGVPSIVYGAFGFTLMLWFGLKTSLLGGIIAVTLVILPCMCRAMDEVIRMIPKDLDDVSLSLGATKFETAFKVIARQALPGAVTAILISFGRAAGDAAAVLFTAGFTDSVPQGLTHPAATLPLAIFFQLGSPLPEVRDRAYASAFILTALILLVSVVARAVSSRFSRHIVK